MRYITYEWVIDYDSGLEGFWPVEQNLPEGFAPVGGLGLAHDLLEHQNGFKGMGSFEDEMQALGAILFVRGYFGQMQRSDHGGANNCIYHGVADEINNLYEIRGWLDGNIHRVSDLGEPEVALALEHTSRLIDDEPYLAVAKKWMQRGYNKAFQRFNGNAWVVNDQFFNLMDEVERRIKGGVEEGDRFRLAWSLNHFQFYKVEPYE